MQDVNHISHTLCHTNRIEAYTVSKKYVVVIATRTSQDSQHHTEITNISRATNTNTSSEGKRFKEFFSSIKQIKAEKIQKRLNNKHNISLPVFVGTIQPNQINFLFHFNFLYYIINHAIFKRRPWWLQKQK